MNITYYHRPSLLTTPDRQAGHGRICELLQQLRCRGTDTAVEDIDLRFPTIDSQTAFIEEMKLRDFATRRHIGLGRIFGSRRHSFWWLPPQFLFVRDREVLTEVFPCRIGENEVEPVDYLERIVAGEPWTIHCGNGMQGKKHKILVEGIKANPSLLEDGLILEGTDVQVSQANEVGFIDFIFEDHKGNPFLIEVKVGADELDKAVGQILGHRELYAAQNRLPIERIRVGICCPYVPPRARAVCKRCGIQWFEIGHLLLKAADERHLCPLSS